MKKSLAACLLSLALLPSCAGTSASDYLQNRAADAVDMLRFHGMVGPGAAARVEVTRLLSLGFVYERNVWAAGLANRELAVWNESIWSWGLLVGYYHETINRGLDGRLSGSYGWTFDREGGNLVEINDPDNPLDALSLRGTLMLVAGLDLEIRVGEMIDFVAGIFGFDPAGDDRDYSQMRRLEEEEKGKSSKTTG